MASHVISLNFAGGNNERTRIACECGEICGTVKTGTSLYEILAIFSEHVKEASNGEEGQVLTLRTQDPDAVS